MTFDKNQKIALVLGGGSAFGFAHIGVIKALNEEGIKPELIVGTSMGAIIGAYYALFEDLDGLTKIIDRISPTSLLFDPGFFSLGIIKCKKIEEEFKIIFGDSTFKDCKIPLIINACDINTGETVIFNDGLIFDAVRSSIAIPGIFAPYENNGRLLVDGGITNNLAINLVKEGYKIIAVKVNPPSDKPVIDLDELDTKNPIKRLSMYFNLINKAFSILINKLEDHLVAETEGIIFIKPNLNEFSYFSFNKHDEIIEAGYEEAKNILNKI